MKSAAPPPQGLELDDAVKRLTDTVAPVTGTETVRLKQAAGRVLAEAIVSDAQIPRDDQSAMDGYALRCEDLPDAGSREFMQVGVSLAGVPWDGVVSAGECVRIMTGALMPAGADTVVIQEEVHRDEQHPGRISIAGTHRTGENVRFAGEEIQPGDRLLDAGRKLLPVDMGLLASVGMAQVSVRKPVRVGILSTGDELREPGAPLPPGCIYNSNLYLLSAAVRRTGATVTEYATGADNPDALRPLLARASAENDLLLSTGGVSVGDVDFVQQVLAELGEIDFWKLRVKPGKPLLMGSIANCKVLGLPGNPVSAAVTYALLGRPLLQALAGQHPEPVSRIRATLTGDLKKRPGRRDFQRGVLHADADGNWQVTSTGPQGSHRLTSLTQANCLIDLALESGPLKAGCEVDCLPLSELF